MNTRSICMLFAVILPVSPLPAQAADHVTTETVHFESGASSSTIKGSISGYDSVEYTVSAKATQTMSVKITGSSNANFNVFAPGAVPGTAEALGSGAVGRGWSGRLPADGRYTVQVYQMRASARRGQKVPYTINFQIR